MPFGDDEQVCRRYRINVAEGNHLFVLVNNITGHFASYNLTEDAIHFSPFSLPLSYSQQPTQTIDQANTSELEEKAPLSADSQAELIYNDEVELEILPPVDVKQIMGIMRYLDSLAEIENTELIPLIDRPLIIVSLRKPLHLIEILRTRPEVDEAKEVTDKESTAVTDAGAEGRRRKIRITLSGNSALDEAKERLGNEVYHTLSS